MSTTYWNERLPLLLEAAADDDEETSVLVIRETLRNGGNVNATDENGETPFHKACCYGKMRAVEYLSRVPGID